MKLKGRIVNLRPMLMEDIPSMQKWFMENPLSIKMIGSRIGSIEAVKAFFENSLKNPSDRRDFIIELAKDNTAIGAISVEKINWIDRKAEAVVFLGSKGFRKREYVWDAYIIFFDYVFNELNLHRIQWNMFEFNLGIIGTLNQWVSETIPDEDDVFKKEGVLEEASYSNGKYHNVYVYGILKHKYNKCKDIFLNKFKERLAIK